MIEKLSRYRTLLHEAEDLSRRIEEIGDIQGVRYDTVQVQTSDTPGLDDIIVKREKIEKIMERKYAKALDQLASIEDYLQSITDPEIREILRHRYVDDMTWDKISKTMYMSKSTVIRKYNAFVSRTR